MKIAVIGAGVSGLASAAHLARAGHEVRVFDTVGQPRPVGAGLLLQPRGLEALDRLGLRRGAQTRGARVSRLLGRTPKGRTVLDLRYADGRAGDTGVGIHRASLFQLLLDAAREAGAHWSGGREVTEITDWETRPRLIFTDGEAGEPFDLTLVCSGAHTALRDQVCGGSPGAVYPWGALWAICPDPDGVRDGDLDQIYDSCRVMIGLLPIGDNPSDPAGGPAVSFFWSLRRDALTAWRDRGLDAFRGELDRLWPRAARAVGAIEDPADFLPAHYRDAIARRWRRGNVLLMGDAAHAMSPQLGQGANLALADAEALADALADDAPLSHALPAYESARRPAARYYALMSRALTPVFQSNSRLIGWARDILMGIGCRLPVIRNWMAWTLVGRGRTPW